jgi:hypothetical protein
MTIDQAKALRNTKMITLIKENSRRERLMAREFTSGKMVKCMMASGRMG